MVNRLISRLIILALALCAVLPCMAWDGGTNAINSVGDTVTHASGVGTPIMLGLIGLFVGVALIVRFVKRGK